MVWSEINLIHRYTSLSLYCFLVICLPKGWLQWLIESKKHKQCRNTGKVELVEAILSCLPDKRILRKQVCRIDDANNCKFSEIKQFQHDIWWFILCENNEGWTALGRAIALGSEAQDKKWYEIGRIDSIDAYFLFYTVFFQLDSGWFSPNYPTLRHSRNKM